MICFYDDDKNKRTFFFFYLRIELNLFSLISTKIISRTLVRTKYFLLNPKEGIK